MRGDRCELGGRACAIAGAPVQLRDQHLAEAAAELVPHRAERGAHLRLETGAIVVALGHARDAERSGGHRRADGLVDVPRRSGLSAPGERFVEAALAERLDGAEHDELPLEAAVAKLPDERLDGASMRLRASR